MAAVRTSLMARTTEVATSGRKKTWAVAVDNWRNLTRSLGPWLSTAGIGSAGGAVERAAATGMGGAELMRSITFGHCTAIDLAAGSFEARNR